MDFSRWSEIRKSNEQKREKFMSGIIGHVTYAILGRQAALEKVPQTAKLIDKHLDSYLVGAYFGADIMTLPGGRCTACGGEYGYGGCLVKSI